MAKKKKIEEENVYGNKELEKKVDELMSMEPGDEPDKPTEKIEIIPETSGVPEFPKFDETEEPEEATPPVDKAVATAPLLGEDKPTKPEKSNKAEKEPEAVEEPAEDEDKTEEVDEPEDTQEEVKEEPPVEDKLELEGTIEELQAKINDSETEKKPVETEDSAELSQAVDARNLDGPALSESDAIDDIVAEESDSIMKIEDKQREVLNAPVKKKPKKGLKSALASIFKDPKKRAVLISSVLIVAVGLFLYPDTRYYILNSAGVRSSSSVKVLDEKTLQPLKNVEVSIGTNIAKTDKEGNANLDQLKLGPQQMSIKKPAFAEAKKNITIGWGSNPLGEQKLSPVGSKYTFKIKDYLSAKAIKGAEVETTNREFAAISNDQGEAVLVVEDTKMPEVKVTIKADKYREESVALDRNDKNAREFLLAPAKRHAYVSKRSGKYDLYSSYVDTKDEQLLLRASGYEKPDGLMIVSDPSSDNIAFVTTRDNNRNKDGFLLSSLYIIDTSNKNNKVVTRSERVQILGWYGGKLVYVKVKDGASADTPDRHKLISYDHKSGEEKELASANYFNDVMVAGGSIYYAPTSFKLSGQVGLFRVNPDGTNKQTVINQEVWNILRQSYEKITFSVGQQWYEYGLNDSKLSKLLGAPATNDSKIILDNSSNKLSAFVDQRDGKGVLLTYNKSDSKDKQLVSEPGLANPIYWLNDEVIVFRISNNNEVSDYAISALGGEKKRVANVTNTAGVDRWYYY